jgi:hypothetical protein
MLVRDKHSSLFSRSVSDEEKPFYNLDFQKAHFECRIIPVSDPTLKIQWLHNGVPVKQGKLMHFYSIQKHKKKLFSLKHDLQNPCNKGSGCSCFVTLGQCNTNTVITYGGQGKWQ